MKKNRFVVEEVRSGRIMTKELSAGEAEKWRQKLQTLAKESGSQKYYKVTEIEG